MLVNEKGYKHELYSNLLIINKFQVDFALYSFIAQQFAVSTSKLNLR